MPSRAQHVMQFYALTTIPRLAWLLGSAEHQKQRAVGLDASFLQPCTHVARWSFWNNFQKPDWTLDACSEYTTAGTSIRPPFNYLFLQRKKNSFWTQSIKRWTFHWFFFHFFTGCRSTSVSRAVGYLWSDKLWRLSGRAFQRVSQACGKSLHAATHLEELWHKLLLTLSNVTSCARLFKETTLYMVIWGKTG